LFSIISGRAAMARRKSTIADVAGAAGVSVATVDRVLNGRGGVSPERERRVLETARKLKMDRALDDVPLRWLRLAVLMQDPANPYYENLKRSFQIAQRAYEVQKVMCLLHYFDSLEPEAVARRIASVSQGADGLVVVAYEHPLVNQALRAVSSAMPVIALASDLPESGRLAYVGSDNRAAGRVAGELMGRFLGAAGGKTLIVTGLHSFIGHEQREMGFRSILRERFANCQVVDTLVSQERREATERLILDALDRHPDLAGIYNISGGNQGIAQALKRRGRDRNTVFITHELTTTSQELLIEGTLDAALDQDPYAEAMRAVDLLLRHYGRILEPPPASLTPITIYLRENLPAIDAERPAAH
jgi:LacI family transcriptional regulator